MPSTVPPIADLLDSATESAVHLEMRDVYAVSPENAEMEHWRQTGERSGPDSAYWRDWVGLVQRTVARGVSVRRARVVSEPASEYIRYEHAGTSVNQFAGELVRWLPREQASRLLLPGTDYWLFDGRLVRFGYFSGDGAVTGHELDNAPDVARLCAAAFEEVWGRALPHDEYKIR
ncbi:hypothetical protein FH609_011760 [Streptomyces sp. 3MP-14]|uniref:DUF6879 domain-containing protein n=1 Tax=Streptomyces mimosae TaxID=2586635 RepID=A0A5N6AGU9_9ACTN|nr:MULTISPECIES: DUF6879 family protein [Streptomyces]KAB8167070.1 hypothetical protein FH607_009210 [Streptomyces mimosae]KAB8177011.1 hypothetical protein FH609_011760 [Streptomyces sp. 3MP-14]